MLEKIISIWSPAPVPTPAPTHDKPFDPTDPQMNPLNPKGLKPCCACPETKSARDDCFLRSDMPEEDEKCKELVRRHVACMNALGFKI